MLVAVSGTLFDTTQSNNMVTIGDASCVVITASATQIVCNVGEPAVGTHGLTVNVASLGDSADFDIEVWVTYSCPLNIAPPMMSYATLLSRVT